MREVSSLFGPGGALSRGIDDYTWREGQEKMALILSESLRRHEFAIIEAGTGIGKTFAYLIMAMEFAQRKRSKLADHDKRRVVIATGTLQLMTQIYSKDVPILQERLGYTADVALLCGRGNYVCLSRYQELFEKREEFTPSHRKEIEEMGIMLRREGAMGLRFFLEGKVSGSLWSEVACERNLCSPSSCPYIDSCFFYRAKGEAKKADIVITNHALLFSDAKVRHDARESGEKGEDLVLPPFQNLVIDEAHGIDQVATGFYGQEYDPLLLETTLSLLAQKRGNRLGVNEKIAALRENMVTLNELLLAHGESREDAFLSSKDALPSSVWDAVSAVGEDAGDLSGEILSLGAKEEISLLGKEVGMAAKVLHHFMATEQFAQHLHVIHYKRREGVWWASLKLIPFSVAQRLREDLYGQMESILFTSGTLSSGSEGDFSYWMKRVGLWEYTGKPIAGGGPVSIPSPFDYARQMLLLAVKGESSMPLWNPEDHQAYDKISCATILSLVKASKGGVLVLLPSYEDLHGYVGALGEEKEGKLVVRGTDRTLLYQGQNSSENLTNAFRREERSVLVGTLTFWEGVDVPGASLSMVIIPRIPFRNPNDPFMRKADELFEKMRAEIANAPSLSSQEKRSMLWKEHPFRLYQIPYAMLLLRQGMGRLIRRSDDRGVVALLDARLAKSSYGKRIQRSFPTEAIFLDPDAMADMARKFFEERT